MDLTRISNINEEDENQIKDINIDKFNDMSNDKTASSLNSNNYINSMNSINNIYRWNFRTYFYKNIFTYFFK